VPPDHALNLAGCLSPPHPTPRGVPPPARRPRSWDLLHRLLDLPRAPRRRRRSPRPPMDLPQGMSGGCEAWPRLTARCCHRRGPASTGKAKCCHRRQTLHPPVRSCKGVSSKLQICSIGAAILSHQSCNTLWSCKAPSASLTGAVKLSRRSCNGVSPELQTVQLELQ
jgi:hypothetical protein